MHTLRAPTIQGLILLNPEIILQIIVFKTVCRICLTFCRSSFIDNFIVKNNFFGTLKKSKVKNLETHLLKKNPAHRFEDDICTNKLKEIFFRKNFFSGTWSFFRDCKTTDLGLSFFHSFFSSVII